MANSAKQKALQKANFLESYTQSNFNISRTCLKVQVSRQTYYNWLKEDPDFKNTLDNFAEADLDNAEESLRIMRQGIPKRNEAGEIIGWILEPVPAAVFFTLKTKGKKRGYAEDGKIDLPDGKLKIEIVANESHQNFSGKLLKSENDKHK